ncbi:MAG: NADH:flavin oxidoreductase [Planctomycetaceae bacterium]|nr:MAG: NADH:flavin oxidoreductase [Planctomycetaceae bacterium]
MARFFRYKTAAELLAEADTLRAQHPWRDVVPLPFELQQDLTPLFQPLQLAGRTIGNRLCIQPMEGCDGTLEGAPDTLTYRRYQRFGAGGAKLVWGEATAVRDDGRMNPRQLCLHAGTVKALEQMLSACRAAHREVYGGDDDLLIGLQLTHSGRYSCRLPLRAEACPLLDPRTRDPRTGQPIDPHLPIVTDAELAALVPAYVQAARWAHQIGCDFVDIKQCHRYLLSELLGAKRRPGEYGGTLERRSRLVREIIQAIRVEVPGLIVATRLNVYDGVPYRRRAHDGRGEPVPSAEPVQTAFGVDSEVPERWQPAEPLQLVRWLRDWGVQLINVSLGNPYANPHLVRPADYPPIDGYEPPEHPLIGVMRHFAATARIQQEVPDIAVVGSGYTWLQEFFPQAGAANVAAGRCTFVGVGRGALSQPDFARHLQETGRLQRKTICRTFSYCTNLMRTKDHPLGQYPTGCPPFDKEVYGPLWKEIEQRSSPFSPVSSS